VTWSTYEDFFGTIPIKVALCETLAEIGKLFGRVEDANLLHLWFDFLDIVRLRVKLVPRFQS
jgi:hypothetical protein